MKEIFKNVIKFALIILAYLLIWIVLTGILEYNKVIFLYNPIFLIIGIALYIFCITLIYKYLVPKLEKIKCLEYILMAIFTIICIISGLYFKLNPTWDMGTVFEIAKEYIELGTYSNTFYLSQFPNNIMMCVLEVVMLYPFKIIGLNDYLTIITIMSSLSISISICISFFCVKKIFDRKKAIIFLIIAVFTTPLYLYCAEYYTDVFSMPISVLLFYIWICMDNKKKWKKITLNVIYALILFIGIKLKLTSAFVFIAIILYELSKNDYKEILKRFSIIGIIILILTTTYNQIVVNKLAPADRRWINEVPKEHWIMMGMNGVGKFSYEEYKYTNLNETYDEKREADIKKIKERILTRSADEHIKNITLKLGFAWHDRNILGTRCIEERAKF